MMKLFRVLLPIFLVLTSFGCYQGNNPLQVREEVPVQSTTFSFDQGRYPSENNLFPEYELDPGDVLDVLFQIQTWEKKDDFKLAVNHTVEVKFVNAPEMNQIQQIKPDGMISLPYLGEIPVAGLTVAQMTDLLKQKYKNILRDPIELYIVVPEFSTQIKELKADLHTAPRGLSRLVTVRPDGHCTFPITGDFFVAGKTIPQVKAELDQAYENFLPGLHVDLFLEKHFGAVVYVLGQVAKPNAYNIMKPITVMEALTLAGSFTDQANLSEILVFRRCKQDRIVTKVDLDSILLTRDSALFFYLRPDDIIYVPRQARSTRAQIMSEIAEILWFRGWDLGWTGVINDDAVIGVRSR